MTKLKRLAVSVVALLLLAAIAFGIAAKFIVSAAPAANANTGDGLNSIKAKSALLLDYHTGTVVFEMNPTAHLPIASMVKIMTLNIIFDEIEKGNLTPDTEITAGINATSMGGSQAFECCIIRILANAV